MGSLIVMHTHLWIGFEFELNIFLIHIALIYTKLRNNG